MSCQYDRIRNLVCKRGLKKLKAVIPLAVERRPCVFILISSIVKNKQGEESCKIHFT